MNMKCGGLEERLTYSNWRELDTNLNWIYEGVPLRMNGRFEHKLLSAWLITQGNVRVGEPGGVQICAGNWVFAPHQNQLRTFSQDAQILSIKFTLRWPDGGMLFEPAEVLQLATEHAPELEQVARLLLQFVQVNQLKDGHLMQSQSMPIESYLRMNQLFQQWLLVYIDVMQRLDQDLRVSRLEDARILQIKSSLDMHPLPLKLDLKAVASCAGLSLGHADTLFTAHYGQTMRGYVDQRRFRAAQHWLTKTNKPVKEMAFELGFMDATACAHWFKKKAGVAPTHYRNAQNL